MTAARRELLIERLAACADPSCDGVIEQPKTGRPRRYCDATCRKNAARRRAWEAWSHEHEAWRAREAARIERHMEARRQWDDATVDPVTEEWQQAALAAGWEPPGGIRQWQWSAKEDALGPRPGEYRTPAHDREPQSPGEYRQGAKSEGGWW